MQAKKITLNKGKYEVTFEDGTVVQCDPITSKGKRRKDDPNFDHVLKFSDGVRTLFVSSAETVTVPDLSYL